MATDSIFSNVKFWVYLVLLIPSIICSLFVLYYLLFDRTLRRALHNHVIIVLLFICLTCQVTIYPWMLYFHTIHDHWQRSYIFCSIWTFIDWGLYITQIMLFAWASIERHILIFHDRWVVTRKKRIFIHYFPPTFIIVYCFICYGIVDFFPFCENLVDDFSAACTMVCSYDSRVFIIWETVVNQILPNLIIIIASMTLIIRILWQNHRARQRIQWRKHRKMAIQLISISLLYLLFSLPNTLMIFLYTCGFIYDARGDVKRYAEFFSYLVILFFPFVCFSSLPEFQNKIRKMLPLRPGRRARLIGPEIITMRNNPNGRILEHNLS